MRIHRIVVPAAASFLLAHTLNGSAVTGWGCNGNGQASAPAGLAYVQAIAAGGYHGLALKEDNKVVCWGNNKYGQASPPTDAFYLPPIY